VFAGERDSETKVAESTVNAAEPVTPPKLALMFVVPAATPVAARVAPPPLPTVATEVSLDVHLLLAVTSCVVESENRPVALKPFCAPMGIVAPEGVTEMDEIVALVTVKFTDALTGPRIAVMTVVPDPELPRGWPVAMPLAPMVATVVSDEDQIT
jgi:hypothetical protein